MTDTVTAPPRLVGRWEAGSIEWLAARTRRLGGHDIGALLGISPYESPFSLWHRKQGNLPDVIDNPQMDAGRRLEPVILGWFADQHPEFYVLDHPGVFVHSERDWQVCSPDGTIYPVPVRGSLATQPTALFEAKFTLYPDELGAPGTDELPLSWKAQARWYLSIWNLQRCYFAVFIGAQGQFVEYVVERDLSDEALMLRAGEKFMASLDSGELPALDSHKATYEAIRHLHPLIEQQDVELPFLLARDYCRSRHALTAARNAAMLATVQVGDVMGNARRATYLGKPVAYRQAKTDNAIPFIKAAPKLPTFTEEEAS